ncbi:hypothetical protein LINPERPRIM_LOCUS40271 [Linum perenne]
MQLPPPHRRCNSPPPHRHCNSPHPTAAATPPLPTAAATPPPLLLPFLYPADQNQLYSATKMATAASDVGGIGELVDGGADEEESPDPNPDSEMLLLFRFKGVGGQLEY